MTTMRSLITSSLRLINSVQVNEVPTSADMDVSLQAMNGLMDSLSNDLLNIHTFSPYRFPLVPGQLDYTLGPPVDDEGNQTNVDWVIERPMRIEQARVLLYGNNVPRNGDSNEGAGTSYIPPSTSTFTLRTTEAAMQYWSVYADYASTEWLLTPTEAGGTFDTSVVATGVTFPTNLQVKLDTTLTQAAVGTALTPDYDSTFIFEFVVNEAPQNIFFVGLSEGGETIDVNASYAGLTSGTAWRSDGYVRANNSTSWNGIYDTWTSGDVMGVVFSAGLVSALFKNGVLVSTAVGNAPGGVLYIGCQPAA